MMTNYETTVNLPDGGGEVIVKLIRIPGEEDEMLCKRCAFETVGKDAKKLPSFEWLRRIMQARHSPIRELHFAFEFIGLPSYIATHLSRHVHARPYIQSQRNDRQSKYDRRAARQDAPVNMIWCMEGEELQIIANKRLCGKADAATRAVVEEMCKMLRIYAPYVRGLLVPMCEYHGGVCHEMQPCGKREA